MKKTSFIFGIIFMLLFSIVFIDLASPMSIAVIPIEPLGVNKDISVITTELIQSELASKRMFKLVERRKLEEVLKEQEIALSDITEKEETLKVGNLLSVNKLLLGTIGLYSSSYLKYILSLKMVDVVKGTIDAATSTGIPSEDQLENGVREAVNKLIAAMSFSGSVERVEGEIVYTSFGSTMGAEKGAKLSVYKLVPVRDKSGKIFMNDKIPVANLIVERATDTGSRCRVLESIGNIEPGFSVEKGSLVLGETVKNKATLTVKTIPDNARVFLDSQFLGVTPLTVKDLKSGQYEITIRAPGYKAYSGRLTLSSGRNIVLKRELEPVIEIEDILLLGKIPKRRADMEKTLLLSLIPGLGENFVGYPVTGVTVPFAIFTDLSIALILNNSRIETESKTYVGDIYRQRLATDYMRDAILSSIVGGMVYLYSILDSVLQADSSFLYPVPIELSFGGAAGYTIQEELGSNAVTGTADSLFFLGYALIAVRSRPLYFSFELQFSDTSLWIMMDTVLRYHVLNNLFVGAGMGFYSNVYGTSNVEVTDVSKIASGIEPLPSDFILPQVVLSYESARVEGDVMLSPIAFGRAQLITYQAGNSWTDRLFVGGLSGYAAKIKLSYFMNLRFGLSASFLYVDMKNSNSELEEGNYARIDSLRYMNGDVGFVFRF